MGALGQARPHLGGASVFALCFWRKGALLLWTLHSAARTPGSQRWRTKVGLKGRGGWTEWGGVRPKCTVRTNGEKRYTGSAHSGSVPLNVQTRV